MNKIGCILGLIAMLFVFASCGSDLTNSVYTFYAENSYRLYAIKFCENNKIIITDIDDYRVYDNEQLYICYGNAFDEAEYRKEGKSIKIIRGGIIKDEMIFEDGVIKWHGVEFELDKRFSTIKKTDKYSGNVYVANSHSEDAIVFAFINDSKVIYIDNMKKKLRNYEVENGKLIIAKENLVLEEGKDKLIFDNSWGTYVFKKENIDLTDSVFITGDFSDLEWRN